MQQIKQTEENVFADIIKKVHFLSASQQRFLQEMLSRPEKNPPSAPKILLKKSFGIWADRKDMKSSIDYVNRIRQGWDTRLERIKE